MMYRWLGAISTAAFLVTVALAGTAVDPEASEVAPQHFCESNPGFGDFDFWVGEWNVYTNDEERQLQGTNSITKHYNSCLLKEEWQGVQGGGGFSVVYYNSVKDEWRQVWVADAYSIDYVGGIDDDGAMVLVGNIFNYRQNTTAPFRGIWTAQKNGSVVQHFDVYDETSGTWNVWFEGLYVKHNNSM